ncbi:MAG: hypothetical protein FWE37_06405 [Spirochaetaceae bacterium]|nr:hypothetical protein [Spirochaetaceae bacterium]
MNVEVLNTILNELKDELNKTGIVNLLNDLATNMQTLAAPSSQIMITHLPIPKHKQNVSQIKITLTANLRQSKVNDFPFLWKESLKHIGFEGLLGNELADKIEDIITKSQTAPAVAYEELVAIAKRVTSLVTAITQLTAINKILHIGTQKLQSGQSELEALVPRTAINDNMEEFLSETKKLKMFVDVFNELVTGTRGGVKLKTIASSDYSLTVAISPKVGLCMLKAVSLTIVAYKHVLDIRKHYMGLKYGLGVPLNEVENLEKYANEKMEESLVQGITQLAEENISSVIKPERKTELLVLIHGAIRELANRIDRGYCVDVRFSDGRIDDDMTIEEEKKVREQIKELSKHLEFKNVSGGRILSLQEVNAPASFNIGKVS